ITTLENIQPGGSTVQFISRYALNALNAHRLLIGTRHLYESVDDGKTFTLIGGFKSGTQIAALTFGTVTSVAYGGKNGGSDEANVAYVGTFDDATKTAKVLLRSPAGGDFNATAYPGTEAPIRIVMDPDNWQTVYVLDRDSKIYRSTNGGD